MAAQHWNVLATTAMLIVLGASAGIAQTGARPGLLIDSMAGVDLYVSYCASCHGRGGRGDGPTAPALKTPTPDLTTLARRNGGTFPMARVRALLTHDEAAMASPAHGSRDMPVWGPIFRGLDPDDTRTRVRIDAIGEHLASIQIK